MAFAAEIEGVDTVTVNSLAMSCQAGSPYAATKKARKWKPVLQRVVTPVAAKVNASTP